MHVEEHICEKLETIPLPERLGRNNSHSSFEEPFNKSNENGMW